MNEEIKLQRLAKLYESRYAPDNFDHPLIALSRNNLGYIFEEASAVAVVGNSYVEIGAGANPAIASAVLNKNQKAEIDIHLIDPRYKINHETAFSARKLIYLNYVRQGVQLHMHSQLAERGLPLNLKQMSTLVMFNTLNYIEPAAVEGFVSDPRIKCVAIANGQYGFNEDRAHGHFTIKSMRPLMNRLGYMEFIHLFTLSAAEYREAESTVFKNYRAAAQYSYQFDTPQFMLWLKPENQKEASGISRSRSVYGVMDSLQVVGCRKSNQPSLGRLFYGTPLSFLDEAFILSS